MSVTHWNPFGEVVSLRDAMDRMLGESFIRSGSALGRTQTTPGYDLYETEDGLTFRFAIPGLRAEDVEITASQGVLTVRGSYPQPQEQQGLMWHVRTLPTGGSFAFNFRLPAEVDVSRAEASSENGILTLTLPKAEASKPRRIQISSAGQRANAQLTAAPDAEADEAKGAKKSNGVHATAGSAS